MTTADAGEVAGMRRPFVVVLSAWWESAREFYRVLLPIRFSFLTVAVLASALFLTDQGNDALAALAEGNPAWKPVWVLGVQVLFAVLIALFAAQTWYWSRQLLRVHFRGQPNPAAWPITVRVAPRALGVAVFVAAIVSLARVRAMYGEDLMRPRRVLLVLMIALGVEAAVFVYLAILRRKRLGPVTTVRRWQEFGSKTLGALRLTTLLGVVVFLGSWLAVQRIARIGTISVLVTTLGVWVALGGIIVYAAMRARIPILTWLLLYAIAISPLTDNHAVRRIQGPMPSRSTADRTFANWYAHLPPAPASVSPSRRPVFIVATEGGGIRAAYWTAAVLASLSDTVPGFTDHLFAVSGVSGGSVGAATYRALLAEMTGGTKLRPFAREALAYDALSPTIAAFTQQDFVKRFIPWVPLPDRARALEQGWETGWRTAVPSDRFSKGFLATTAVEADRLPSLFLNGTITETGERTITSNVHIDSRFAAASDALDEIGSDIPMSTGAHNSARFPYVSPLGTLRDRHIADGGYFDNSGAITAAELLDLVRQHPDFKAGLIRPYVIFISYRALPVPVRPANFANELIGPLLTYLGTGGAHATTASSDLRGHVPPQDCTTFTLIQHPSERFPLGWLLAARTRDLIDKQMGPDSAENGNNVKTIAAALGVTPQRDAVWDLATRNEAKARVEERQ